MREPAFTPGPWSLVINKFGENVLVQPATDRTLFLLDDGETTDWNQDEADANASLIAAAPALYEAVEALVECFIKRGPFDEPLGSSEQAPSINAGIAALTLALGDKQDG